MVPHSSELRELFGSSNVQHFYLAKYCSGRYSTGPIKNLQRQLQDEGVRHIFHISNVLVRLCEGKMPCPL